MKIKYYLGLITGILPSFYMTAAELISGLNIEPSARWRYQEVKDTTRGNAQANTLKLRLNADWQWSNNWQGFGQFDYVHAFAENHYNSVTVSRATSPIPDPPGADLNQLMIKYQSDANWSAALGRQAIGFDNERHIGSVAFWQNAQTFDAIRLNYQDHLGWKINYLYVSKVKRIFGDKAKPILPPQDIRFVEDAFRPKTELGKHQHNSHLINLRYIINQHAKLSLFAYLLDNQSARILSSDTYGARLNGDFKPSRTKYSYTLEYALQKAKQDNPWDYKTDYLLVEGALQFNSHQTSLGLEKFGQDNGFSFATSLGTNHKFQGWADIFSGYGKGGGLHDIYLSYKGRDAKFRWRLVLHQFRRPDFHIKVGNEIDLELAYRYDRKWEFKLIAAKYFAGQGLAYVPESNHNLNTWMVSAAYNL